MGGGGGGLVVGVGVGHLLRSALCDVSHRAGSCRRSTHCVLGECRFKAVFVDIIMSNRVHQGNLPQNTKGRYPHTVSDDRFDLVRRSCVKVGKSCVVRIHGDDHRPDAQNFSRR